MNIRTAVKLLRQNVGMRSRSSARVEMGKGSAKREIGTMRKMRTERKRRIVSNIELWIGFMVVDVVMVAV